MNLEYFKLMSLVVLLSAFSFSTLANQNVKNVREIKKNLSTLTDKQVTISGEVDDIYGPHTFVLEDEAWFGFDDEIIIVSKTPLAELELSRFYEDAKVTVTGTVQNYSVIEVEKEMGWTLDPEAKEEWEGIETVLVLDTLTPL